MPKQNQRSRQAMWIFFHPLQLELLRTDTTTFFCMKLIVIRPEKCLLGIELHGIAPQVIVHLFFKRIAL